jgi:hypothetical protein
MAPLHRGQNPVAPSRSPIALGRACPSLGCPVIPEFLRFDRNERVRHLEGGRVSNIGLARFPVLGQPCAATGPR